MKNIVFFIVAVLTFVSLILIDVLLILRRPSKSKEIGRILEYVQYMIFFLFPIACFAIILQYYILNTLLCAVVWILLFEISNRILSHRLLSRATVDIKVAMSFLGMTLCAIYFGVQAIIEWSKDYAGMMCTIIALMLGFFVPIDILLANISLKEKGKEIFKATKLSVITKGIWIIYVCTIIYFIVCTFMDKTEIYDKYVITAELGLIVGVFAALPIITIVSKKTANALKDCYDTRQDIFRSEGFESYRTKVERFLKYTDKERYDYVEAFLFYKAFISACKDAEKYEADSMLSVCEHIKQEYSWCTQMTIAQRYSYNENIYVLRNGKKKFCGDIMTSPWPLFKEYLRSHGKIVLEEGSVPKQERVRYTAAGFTENQEMWLLYFLENYHKLSYKEKKRMFPQEVRSFLINSYREEAMWLIPVGCNMAKMRSFVGESKRKERYDFGDLILKAIYEWYNMHSSNSDEAVKQLIDCLGDEKDAVEKCEIWLGGFKDWKEFVVANKLQKLVKKSKNIFVEKYGEPIMFFEGHTVQNMLPESKKEWRKMFKKMSSMIYNRY